MGVCVVNCVGLGILCGHVRVGVDAGDDHTKLTATFNLMASSFMVGIVPTNNAQEMKDPGVRILLDYEACRSVLHRRAAILSHTVG